MSDLDRALQEIGITKWYVHERNIKLYINFLLSQSILQINIFLKNCDKVIYRHFSAYKKSIIFLQQSPSQHTCNTHKYF